MTKSWPVDIKLNMILQMHGFFFKYIKIHIQVILMDVLGERFLN